MRRAGCPAAFCSAKRMRARSLVGCTCSESGSAAASSFIRNGNRGPNESTHPRPESVHGCTASMTSSRPRPSSTRDGSAGCAPNHISATGSSLTGRPHSLGMCDLEPHA